MSNIRIFIIGIKWQNTLQGYGELFGSNPNIVKNENGQQLMMLDITFIIEVLLDLIEVWIFIIPALFLSKVNVPID